MEPSAKVNRWFQDAGLKKVIFLTIGFKLAALIVIAVGAVFLSFRTDNYLGNFHYPFNQMPNFFTRFSTWDAQHYLYLSDFGYKPNLLSNAFFPLFPLLIHGVGFLFLNNHLLTGLFLSTLFTVMAVGFMYRVVRELYNESVAFNACLLLLAFPTSFFLGLVYSDSLFLMLATGLFYFEMKNKKWLYFLFAFLLPLARPIGALVLIPVIFKAFQEGDGKKRGKFTGVLIGSVLGFATYLLIMKFFTGDAWSGFTAQNYYHMSKSVSNLFHPIDWFLNNFVYVKLSFNSPFTGFLDRFMFVIYLVVLIDSWRWLPRHLWLYVLLIGLISGLSGDMTSFIRYWVVLFPLFITLAIRFKSSLRLFVAEFAVVQIVFILLYSINDWVA